MSPQERSKIDELTRQIESLSKMVNDMQNKNTISPDFKRVLELNALTTSAKSSGSENEVINESGSETHSVLEPPDAFLQVTIDATVYYIPAFT